VQPIDGAALRKESWILGQCPGTYKSVQEASFKNPGTNAETKMRANKAAADLRARVAGTSIKNESPSHSTDARLAFQTNTQIVHKSLGEIKPIDKNVQLAQKTKLTKANFIVGKSPHFYGTTNKSAFYPMRTQAYSQDQRKVAVDNNRRTNFIGNAGSFETPQKKFDFAAVPDKGSADTSQVRSMIDNLRREHFKLGE